MMSLLFALAFAAASEPAIDVDVITTINGVKDVVAKHKGKVVVLKFWATWCDPCVKQFPDFVRTMKKLDSAVTITVSVDLKQGLESDVVPFLKRFDATFPAYLLDVEDPTPVMASVDPQWTGTLPATFVYDKKGMLKKRYIGHSPDLETTVKTLLR